MRSRGDSTREQIVVAATRLFYGKGIRAVSMDALAETAGVPRPA
ncbi:helix-turn-helix domain-containing protein [Bradyrhizobium sp. WSM3983]